MRWNEYPIMKPEDIYEGIELICIYDDDIDNNYTGILFFLNFLEEHRVTPNEYDLDITMVDNPDRSSGWLLSSINGINKHTHRYTIRMIPTSWASEEDLFILRLGGTLS
jgi:hypothetical protein